MASWQSIWILDHKELNVFIFIMMCFLQLTTKEVIAHNGTMIYKYTKASEQLEHAMVDIRIYAFYFAKRCCQKCTAVTSQLPMHY